MEALSWLEIKRVHGAEFLENCNISSPRIQKPGLALAGSFSHIRQGMVELFGAAEISYLGGLGASRAKEVLKEFVKYNNSLYIVSKGLDAGSVLIEVAEENKIPVVEIFGKTMQIFNEASYYLDYALSEEVSLHGVSVEVYGLGVIITGKSGIGKSECALELIKRGHRLIADDVINIKRRQHYLIATSASLLRGMIELRGVGVLDICKMYGITAVRPRKKVDLIIDFMDFAEWNNLHSDRLGLENPKREILGLEIPLTVCPVSPGRNMSEVVELASKNRMLKIMGSDTTKDFLNALEGNSFQNHKEGL